MNAHDGHCRRGVSERKPAGSSIRRLKAIGLGWACLLVLAPAWGQDGIGTIRGSQGNVVVVREGHSLAAGSGFDLRTGDVLRTADKASAKFALADGTQVIVGPASQVAMDSFSYEAESRKGNLLVSIFKGTMRMISGAIAKANPGQAMVKTPTATAGIRGTDFIVDVR